MRVELKNGKNKHIKICVVDNCLIRSAGKKCDFLFLLSKRAILVELKGKDRTRALYQLIETAEALNSKQFHGRVESYVITSRVPKADTKYQTELTRLRKRFQTAKCCIPQQKNHRLSISV